MARPKRSWRQQLEHAHKERTRHQRQNRADERDPRTGEKKPPGERPLTDFGRWLFGFVGQVKRAEAYRPYVEAARSTNDAASSYVKANFRKAGAVNEIGRVGKDIERLGKAGLLQLPWKSKP